MSKHISVLLNESIQGLNLKKDSIIVDCTLGYGGHSSEILKQIPNGFLYAFDQDMEAIKYSEEELKKISNNFEIIHANFSSLKSELEKRGIDHVDGILFDLGFSSPQIDNESRGFSFMKDAALDMRMDQTNKKSAYDVVNNYNLEDLTNIFYKYAEEKYSRSIAKNIISSRPINTTLELVDVIKKSVPVSYALTRHPERVIFQAIRIEVNNELGVLESTLPDAINLLNKDGRIAVITFHSLEDRIVKNIFKEVTHIDERVKGLPNIPKEYLSNFRLVNNKAIIPSDTELDNNNRSRSAKLRIIERIR